MLSGILLSFYRFSSPSQWKVYAGDLTLSQMYTSSSKSVMQIISHDNFDTETNNYDIALMKLSRPLQMQREL